MPRFFHFYLAPFKVTSPCTRHSALDEPTVPTFIAMAVAWQVVAVTSPPREAGGPTTGRISQILEIVESAVTARRGKNRTSLRTYESQRVSLCFPRSPLLFGRFSSGMQIDRLTLARIRRSGIPRTGSFLLHRLLFSFRDASRIFDKSPRDFVFLSLVTHV